MNENFNISVPSGDIGTDKNVVFKIQPQKKVEQKVQKFRSFNLWPASTHNGLQIAGKPIGLPSLYQILLEHGLSKTMPYKCFVNGEFANFDWNPPAYNGPVVWDFDWNSVPCSITGTNNYNSSFITIRVHNMTPGVGEKVMQEISDELLARYKDPTPKKTMKIYTAQRTVSGMQWVEHTTRFHRRMETIYIDPAIKHSLITELSSFYQSAEEFDLHGVPYKRVHLLDGPPGAGKSSTIVALASIFDKDIAKMTVADMNSREVENLFINAPQNAFVVLEDVDALFVKREGTGLVDFSTMLQCMDGIATKRGLVVFMTTNHVELLDEAFVREARVDCKVTFTLPGPEQLRIALETLAPQFKHEHDEYLKKNPNISIAKLQHHVFSCKMGKKTTIL